MQADREACGKSDKALSGAEAKARQSADDAEKLVKPGPNAPAPNADDLKQKLATAASDKAAADAARIAARELASLRFYLVSKYVVQDGTKDAWMQLLTRPAHDVPLAVSVGSDGTAWQSEATIKLDRIRWWGLIAWAVIFAIAIFWFVRFRAHERHHTGHRAASSRHIRWTWCTGV